MTNISSINDTQAFNFADSNERRIKEILDKIREKSALQKEAPVSILIGDGMVLEGTLATVLTTFDRLDQPLDDDAEAVPEFAMQLLERFLLDFDNKFLRPQQNFKLLNKTLVFNPFAANDAPRIAMINDNNLDAVVSAYKNNPANDQLLQRLGLESDIPEANQERQDSAHQEPLVEPSIGLQIRIVDVRQHHSPAPVQTQPTTPLNIVIRGRNNEPAAQAGRNVVENNQPAETPASQRGPIVINRRPAPDLETPVPVQDIPGIDMNQLNSALDLIKENKFKRNHNEDVFIFDSGDRRVVVSYPDDVLAAWERGPKDAEFAKFILKYKQKLLGDIEATENNFTMTGSSNMLYNAERDRFESAQVKYDLKKGLLLTGDEGFAEAQNSSRLAGLVSGEDLPEYYLKMMLDKTLNVISNPVSSVSRILANTQVQGIDTQAVLSKFDQYLRQEGVTGIDQKFNIELTHGDNFDFSSTYRLYDQLDSLLIRDSDNPALKQELLTFLSKFVEHQEACGIFDEPEQRIMGVLSPTIDADELNYSNGQLVVARAAPANPFEAASPPQAIDPSVALPVNFNTLPPDTPVRRDVNNIDPNARIEMVLPPEPPARDRDSLELTLPEAPAQAYQRWDPRRGPQFSMVMNIADLDDELEFDSSASMLFMAAPRSEESAAYKMHDLDITKVPVFLLQAVDLGIEFVDPEANAGARAIRIAGREANHNFNSASDYFKINQDYIDRARIYLTGEHVSKNNIESFFQKLDIKLAQDSRLRRVAFRDQVDGYQGHRTERAVTKKAIYTELTRALGEDFQVARVAHLLFQGLTRGTRDDMDLSLSGAIGGYASAPLELDAGVKVDLTNLLSLIGDDSLVDKACQILYKHDDLGYVSDRDFTQTIKKLVDIHEGGAQAGDVFFID